MGLASFDLRVRGLVDRFIQRARALWRIKATRARLKVRGEWVRVTHGHGVCALVSPMNVERVSGLIIRG